MNRKVASTLTEILHNPIVEASLDRSQSIGDLIEESLKAWEVDLDKRSPVPAYIEGLEGEPIYQGTDFDMFTFLMGLAQRRAVINIPSYELLIPAVLKSNQRIVSRENRHGQIFGVISNQKVHSFSVRIKDFNVVEEKRDGHEEVGAFRNFAVVDYLGEWHEGWQGLEFRAAPEERRFIEEHNLVTLGEPVRFRYFVHPNLAWAFYGSRYIATKALAIRAQDQARHYRALAKALREYGVRLPSEELLPSEEQPKVVTSEQVEGGIRETAPNIEARLILPPPKGEYPVFSMNGYGESKRHKKLPSNPKALQGVLRYASHTANDLSYGRGAALRAPVRAVELAYFLHGFKKGHDLEDGREITPSWGIPPWIRGYRESNRHRTRWNALQLTQDPDVVLLYRAHETNVVVRKESAHLYRESKVVSV